MNLDDLKSHVTAAIREEWSAFTTAHPHLSSAIEETFWVVSIAESLHDDPQFQAAMNNAQTVGTILEQGPAIVKDFVQRWLKRVG